MKKAKVLFISYNAVSDSVAQSQVILYLEQLAMRGFGMALLSYEKANVKTDSHFANNTKKRLSELGIDWYCLRYHKRPSLPATIYDIVQGVFYVFFLLNKHKFNVIHARMIVPAAICLVLRKFKRFRWLFDMRGLVAEEYVGHGRWREGGIKFRLVKFFEKYCLLNTDFITVLTHKQKDYILSLPFLNKKEININVIPSCVDLNRFIPLSKRNALTKQFSLEGKFILIYLGSLGTCYLLSEMMDCFLYLRRKLKDVFFLFVTNDGNELVLNKAKKKGLQKDEFGIISCPFEKVPEVVSLGDVGIYFIESYNKFGSFPIKFGEFLACQKPLIINSGIGDTEELVTHNRVGVVIKNFTEEEYLSKVRELLDLLKEGEALSKRCRATAEKYLSLNMGAERYQHIYKELMA